MMFTAMKPPPYQAVFVRSDDFEALVVVLSEVHDFDPAFCVGASNIDDIGAIVVQSSSAYSGAPNKKHLIQRFTSRSLISV